MACNYPTPMYELLGHLTETGKKVILAKPPYGGEYKVIPRPCGKCMGCRIQRRESLAIRLAHESRCHDHSAFVTLTYSEQPYGNSLYKPDAQKFIRSLRKITGQKGRYFFTGEYGGKLGRPHLHGILYGFEFADRIPSAKRKGNQYWTSDTLSKAWKHGYADLTNVTPQNCMYVTKYHIDKVTGPKSENHYAWTNPDTGEIHIREPEFALMSLKPGLGADWFKKYGMSDIYDSGGFIIINGRRYAPPRYYDELLRRSDPERYEEVKAIREKEGFDIYSSLDRRREIVDEVKRLEFERFLERSLA